MTFADSWLLWGLGPLLALWLLAFAATSLRPRPTVRFPNVGALRRGPRGLAVRLRPFAVGLRVLVVALLMLAMARPQQGRERTQVRTDGVDIVIAVDTSGSMAALDLDADRPIQQRRDRLAVAADVLAAFIRSREHDQLGLVVFGSEAFTQCPLTLDHRVLGSFLERLEIGMVGDATAMGVALGTAVKRLADSPAKSKVVILLTDGRSNAGAMSPSTAAEAAAALGVKVYAIGVGTRGKAPVVVETLFGPRVEYIEADLDEAGLKAVAERTGGAYFRAEDTEGLTQITQSINELEKTEIQSLSYMEYDERYPMLVWPAVFLLLLELLLLGTRLRRLP
jgi:Ca-activated chloride channel homolog